LVSTLAGSPKMPRAPWALQAKMVERKRMAKKMGETMTAELRVSGTSQLWTLVMAASRRLHRLQVRARHARDLAQPRVVSKYGDPQPGWHRPVGRAMHEQVLLVLPQEERPVFHGVAVRQRGAILRDDRAVLDTCPALDTSDLFGMAVRTPMRTLSGSTGSAHPGATPRRQLGDRGGGASRRSDDKLQLPLPKLEHVQHGRKAPTLTLCFACSAALRPSAHPVRHPIQPVWHCPGFQKRRAP